MISKFHENQQKVVQNNQNWLQITIWSPLIQLEEVIFVSHISAAVYMWPSLTLSKWENHQ